MRRCEIVFDLPTVVMKQQILILGLPKMEMDRVRWVVGLPQFTVVNVNAKTEEVKKKGQALSAEGQQLGTEMRAKIEAEVANFKASLLSTTQASTSNVVNQFDRALGAVKSAIDGLQAQGVDPIKVPTAGGDLNLRKTYAELSAKRAETLSDIEKMS